MWLSIAFMVIKLMEIAEGVYKDIKGKGQVKKSSVMAATKEIVNDMAVVSTGGQQETWMSFEPLISAFIDNAVTIANGIKPGLVTDEEFEKRKAGLTQ